MMSTESRVNNYKAHRKTIINGTYRLVQCLRSTNFCSDMCSRVHLDTPDKLTSKRTSGNCCSNNN